MFQRFWHGALQRVAAATSVPAAGTIGATTALSLFAVGRPSTNAPVKAETARPPSARLLALHSVLLDLARVPEARAVDRMLPRLLEDFWQELRSSEMPVEQKEVLLHRLADSYSHGTLCLGHAEKLVQILESFRVQAVLDPIAHTGFHVRVLRQVGLPAKAADASPSPLVCWEHVDLREAAETDWDSYRDWALLLSWVPYWSEVGAQVLSSFKGNVVVVLGDEGEWTGTAGFREELRRNWLLFADWPIDTPWPRVREQLRIFKRGKNPQ
eukprot:TRINITY_DN67431_c0_g1_i1.p1 TRINITY_DN67431_c0_g1~~TRINITY_DN67431_c0_g1_i1.p1  ORF type:complete len:269 (-),score=53.03 TRINITY_DN67431_c0_g1_i1:33-839(-)